jgi:hypothetical protein
MLGEVAEASDKTSWAALGQTRPAVDAMMETLTGLASRADEINAQFGIKLGAKAGALLASADAEAQFTVSLKWKASNGLDAVSESTCSMSMSE